MHGESQYYNRPAGYRYADDEEYSCRERRAPVAWEYWDDEDDHGRADGATGGAEGNARLTGLAGMVLLVLFAAEGFTILAVRQMLTLHFFIGMLLAGPVLLKLGSTIYRFTRYYAGEAEYRRKGPPALPLRVLGPFVILTSLAVIGTGIMLALTGPGSSIWLLAHKAAFVLWFGAMTIHVLGHLGEVFRLAPRDWLRRTRRDVTGAGPRQWLIAASLVVGILLGFLFLGRVGPWLAAISG
jgi:hypothetical protein